MVESGSVEPAHQTTSALYALVRFSKLPGLVGRPRNLSISSQVSPSLPSDPASRRRPWPQVIVLLFCSLVLTIVDFNHIYTVPMLGTLQSQLSTPFALRATVAIVLHDGRTENLTSARNYARCIS